MTASFFVTVAYAAEAEADGEKSLWEKVQEAGSEAAGYVKEHGPGWVEAAKDGAKKAADKAGEFYDSAKEAAPEVIESAKEKVSEAQQQFSDWNAGQQTEFFEWFEDQTGTGVSEPATTPAQEAPTNASSDTMSEQPLERPRAEEPTVPPEVWDSNTGTNAASEAQEPVLAQAETTTEKPDEPSSSDAVTATEPAETSNLVAVILAAVAVAIVVGVMSSLTVMHMRDSVSKRRHSSDHHFDEHHY